MVALTMSAPTGSLCWQSYSPWARRPSDLSASSKLAQLWLAEISAQTTSRCRRIHSYFFAMLSLLQKLSLLLACWTGGLSGRRFAHLHSTIAEYCFFYSPLRWVGASWPRIGPGAHFYFLFGFQWAFECNSLPSWSEKSLVVSMKLFLKFIYFQNKLFNNQE